MGEFLDGHSSRSLRAPYTQGHIPDTLSIQSKSMSDSFNSDISLNLLVTFLAELSLLLLFCARQRPVLWSLFYNLSEPSWLHALLSSLLPIIDHLVCCLPPSLSVVPWFLLQPPHQVLPVSSSMQEGQQFPYKSLKTSHKTVLCFWVLPCCLKIWLRHPLI